MEELSPRPMYSARGAERRENREKEETMSRKSFILLGSIVLLLAFIFVYAVLHESEEMPNKGKRRKVSAVTPTAVVINSPTEEPDYSPTPTIEELPTPTSKPDDTPTPTPLSPYDEGESILHDDLTYYLNTPIGDLIEEVGREYLYQYWEMDYYTGTTGGLFFDDDYSMFMFEDSEETLDPSCEIAVIAVYQSKDMLVSRCIGRDVYTDMSYDGLMKSTRNRLKFSEPGIEYDYYSAYGVCRGYRYLFIWYDSDPRESSNAPDVSYVTKTGINWID